GEADLLAALLVFLARLPATLLIGFLLARNDRVDAGGRDVDGHHGDVDGRLGDGAAGKNRQSGEDKGRITHDLILARSAQPCNRQSDEKKLHIRSLALIAIDGCLRPCWVSPPGQLWPPVSVTQSSTGAPPLPAG